MMITRCCLCRRVWEVAPEFPQGRWSSLAGFLERQRLSSAEIAFTDVSCSECDLFYRLMVTYGSGTAEKKS